VAGQIVIFLSAIVMNLENRKHPSYDDLLDALRLSLKGYQTDKSLKILQRKI
jgi:hypothetical protein